jgi:ubiquinone biosynthesis protein Coq4
LSADDAGEFVMAHLLDSHNIWHVVTGWGNDESGEVGLDAFYLGQLNVRLIGFMIALIFLNTIFSAPGMLRERMEARPRQMNLI